MLFLPTYIYFKVIVIVMVNCAFSILLLSGLAFQMSLTNESLGIQQQALGEIDEKIERGK